MLVYKSSSVGKSVNIKMDEYGEERGSSLSGDSLLHCIKKLLAVSMNFLVGFTKTYKKHKDW